MSEILHAANLSFLDIIKYPEISINEGDCVFLVGESGCGKSTLLKLFNLTASPTSGKILYFGEDINNIDTIKLRREALLVGQTVFLFSDTIENNFRRYYEYRDETPPTTAKMKDYLTMVLADFPLDKSCDTLSGGEKQRVYIAIFLSFMPKALMLDEPTSALDYDNAYLLIKNIKTFAKKNNMTLIIISHDKSLPNEFAEKIIELKRDSNE